MLRAWGSRQAFQSTIPSLREKIEIASMCEARGASRSAQCSSQQLALGAVGREDPPDSQVTQRRHHPDRPQDPRRDGQRIDDRRAQHHERRDAVRLADGQRAGQGAAAALPDQDDRFFAALGLLADLHLQAADDLLGAAGVQAQAAHRDAVSAASQPGAHDRQGTVAGHEAGDQKDRLSVTVGAAERLAREGLAGQQAGQLASVAQLSPEGRHGRRHDVFPRSHRHK